LQEKLLPEEELLQQSAGAGCTAERMGLTPDWIISTAAFKVFQLTVSCAAQAVHALMLITKQRLFGGCLGRVAPTCDEPLLTTTSISSVLGYP